MEVTVIDSLKLLGVRHGYRRPLDRHDFPHDHIPEWARRWVPRNLTRFLKNQWGMANVGLLTGDDAAAQDIYTQTTKQNHPLGAIGMARDGRIFRYASAGAADLVVGNIVQSAAPIPLHLALTSAAQNIGDGTGKNPIVVTPGATAGAANLYAEGVIGVDTGPDPGRLYSISGHAAITASVAFNLFLYPDDTLQLAWTTATRYGLHHNPYKTVIQCPTTVTACQVGGVVCIITANTTVENYGWLQTRGPFQALINGTPAVGTGVVASVTTAGAVDAAGAVALEINYRIIGRMMQVGVSTKFNTIFLTLD
jgi:hypothetical protein